MNKIKLSELNPGDKHYKAYVGPPLTYDLVSSMQFSLLTAFGLRSFHKLLDIGCGSLRLGKLIIPFLDANNYYGIEPNDWLIDEGFNNELGKDIVSVKSPTFNTSSDFNLAIFNKEFDYLIAQSIFSHASSKQITTCLKQVKKVMKTNGIFLATFMLGIDNYSGDEWVYPGCVEYKHSFIINKVREQKLDALKINWHHPNNQTWYVIFHPENKKEIKKRIKILFLVNKSKPMVVILFKLKNILKQTKLGKILIKIKNIIF